MPDGFLALHGVTFSMLRDCSADKKGEDVSASSSFFCKPKFVHDVCPALQRRTGVSHKQGRAPISFSRGLDYTLQATAVRPQSLRRWVVSEDPEIKVIFHCRVLLILSYLLGL